MKDDPKVGPTGEFPRGKPLFQGDRGGLYAEFAVFTKRRLVMFRFETIAVLFEETK